MIKKRKKTFSPVKKLTIGLIVVCLVLVVFALVFSLINEPESQVKRLISELSADYYENYLYEDFSQSEQFKSNPESVMELYEANGFSPISLRQILLYNNRKNAKFSDYLKTYCDENQTTIKFYPDEPYGKKDYHVVYTYSCEF